MSLGKDKFKKVEGEFEGGHTVDMRGQSGDFKYSKEQLAEICNLDNHHLAGLKDFPQLRLSSQMIMEQYSGPEGIMSSLFTNAKTGIDGSPGDLKDRRRVYGSNSFPPPKIKGIMELIMENFEDPINRVLLGAAIVSLIIGLYKEGFPEGLIEGTSIAIALVIIISVTSINNWASEQRLAELVAMADEQTCAVFRGGSDKPITIDATELVVGDLVKFAMGEKVPADMMMVEGQDVTTNESELTGEPDSLEKVPITQDNYRDGTMCTMLAKSLIDGGIGKAIVMAVGTNTVAGVITEKVQKEDEQTLLQEKLEIMAGKIGNIGMLVAIGTFFASVIRIIIEATGGLPCGCQNLFICKEPVPNTCEMYNFGDINNEVYPMLLEAVIIGITVVVVAIPEGLPLAVTISLSFSSKKMQKLNNLVRKIASSETMGGATHICSDKTGTLTQNKMTVMAVYACETVVEAVDKDHPEVVPNQAKNTFTEFSCKGQSIYDTLAEGIMWNSSAWIEKNDGKDDKITDEFVTKGNVTEQGIMKFFMNSMTPMACLDKKAELTDEKTLCIVPFTSKRKMGSIVVRNLEKANTDQEVRVYCKGAPDMLLQKVLYTITKDGQTQPMNRSVDVPADILNGSSPGTQDTYRGLFDRTVKKFATQAYRTILVTYKDMSMREFQKIKLENNDFAKEADREILETDLIAVGLFGLQDPLRSTIVPSIIQCNDAGIQVVMCTGDNIDTAIAISKNAGIVTEEEIQRNQYAAMTGKDFREAVGGLKQVSDGEKQIDVVADMQKFREIKEQLKVLARSSPEDKYILVTGIQDSGGVVAVTGDGTNDAPALTKADVGFAMGITGTDVAKGACDIILLDDNFASIVVALKYGRNVYDNVRKFLQFQLTVNFVAMFIVFLGAVITKKSPLNAVQMLWVNLIMDTFAALALATEPPPPSILKRKPYKKDAPIIQPVMSRNVQGHCIYQAAVLLIILFAGPHFLLDHPYELQCSVYDNSTSKCDTSMLNPYYTKTEYYDPGLWIEFTDDGNQHMIKGKKHLKAGFAFDPVLLYRWRCNLFSQANYHYSGRIDSMGLCFKEDAHHLFTDPQAYSQWMHELSKADKAIVKEFALSKWHLINPSDEGITVEASNDQPEKTYTSRGYSTEETKLFSFVFNAFVFMQVFNQINARKLEEGEYNVFSGMCANLPFVGIMFVTIIVQLLMVELGGRFVKCWPLNGTQNAICIFLGFLALPWGLIIKIVPTRFFLSLSLEDKSHEKGKEKSKAVSQIIKNKKK